MRGPRRSTNPTNPVVCLGETMAVLTPRQPGVIAEGQHFAISAGGAESNVACYLAALGIPSAWLGRVGDDGLGQMVVTALEHAGVITDGATVDSSRRTGLYVKERTQDGTMPRYYRTGSAGSAMGPGDLAHALVKQAPVAHCSGITSALSPSCLALMRQLVRSPRSKRWVSFDVNWRPGIWASAQAGRDITAELARSADLVFVGRDESAALWDIDDPLVIYHFLGSPQVLVVKDAANGATLVTGEISTWEPAPRVDVVEPVGAGDAFAAGTIAGLLAGLDASAVLRLGHAVAATALATTADVGDLQTVKALRGRLETQQSTVSYHRSVSTGIEAPGEPPREAEAHQARST